MTDLEGKISEPLDNEATIEGTNQPSDLEAEGKRFGEALLADQGFIQAIS